VQQAAKVTRGIALGCPMSPFMGVPYLQRLDQRLEGTCLADTGLARKLG
jgi:hypothetical protein